MILIAGLVVTFGRGMWVSTALGILVATACRLTARSALRFVVVLACLALGVLAADFAVRGSAALPSGILYAGSARVQSSFNGDANVSIRYEEMRLVVSQTQGHGIIGLGLASRPGYDYGPYEGADLIVVHNGYYNIYGRLGGLGVIAFIVYAAVVLTLGVLATRRAAGFDLVLAFGGLVGFVQGVSSSWTQGTNTSLSGIVAMSTAAAFVALVFMRTRPVAGRRRAVRIP